ncbi:D-aminoacyl-tRNA deacylase [Pseudohongiella nitratireducens]|uniref:D-aminoacyl-tRNA deacylase n=1 Tax=Pseudohongiella nitratireducens TaxID=1768907 RepID=A0A917GKB5_9GAMM|nr:D-aminoacyl-tRNA deacylase [Pseudohongiella nitratireducens]MDF1622866.1 D-aminoacyl-tRNA deacylase [Pseudohongiella nitratireducens]GGG49774.1 D-aminoacyl-tRNA deacylase [Pseudohongiella nitratireducens]
MIALIQRVNHASVSIAGEVHSQIGQGLLLLLGLEKEDTFSDGQRLIRKVLAYRVFADDLDRMNLSLKDISGELLLVSQFTLAGSTQKGLRPSFSSAMPPEPAKALYEELVAWVKNEYPATSTGEFGADMKISLENDGPVTFILNS